MLEELKVKNVALISEANLRFGEGLNILTGETGAGKSILIDSIFLALGNRADKGLIRQGAEHAYVELAFRVDREDLKSSLAQLGVADEGGRLILTRRVEKDKSVCRINGEVVSVKLLRQVAELLIDIHGQQENTSLLQERTHLQFLDLYCGQELSDLKEKLAHAYYKHHMLVDNLEEAQGKDSRKEREMDLAIYELSEIEGADLSIGEDEILEDRFRVLSGSEKIAESLKGASDCLDDYEGRGALSLTDRALSFLQDAIKIDPSLSDLAGELSEAEEQMRSAARQIARKLEASVPDEELVRETQARLDEINRLKHKYGNTLEEVLSYAQEKRDLIRKLEDFENYLADLKRQLQESEELLQGLCNRADEIRRKGAEGLEKELMEALPQLGFTHAECRIEVEQDDKYLGKDGNDHVSFLISLNAGENLKNLTEVASGGELSRIMLALKSILAGMDRIPTQIFDEIDAGISGQTAWKVAEKMAAIGRSRQLICITHLPQIAAMADHHFRIVKSQSDTETVTDIRMLDRSGMVEELARLMGSDEISESALSNAEEMKSKADQEKQK
ncbi:MAG: DNA repair protein RecN [Lachnospiraceae bacterium]|nr:DNA repair protein RecN [Lachnospiraceae bacterium]